MNDLNHHTLKGYELRERIGAGGFGVVYRAYQPGVGRDVAIKVILPEHANQPEFIRRFESEVQLVARLEHPHIVPLYDYWRDPDGAYFVMRWLRGRSLRDALQQGAFDLPSVVSLLDQIASALALAHRNQVIHRDIKPGNILLDEDRNAYLSDFGSARDLTMTRNSTPPNLIVGSLEYTSPEQALAEPATLRSDIYSLGVTLYEVITGHHPFENVSPVEQLTKHINEPLPVITTLDSTLATEVNRIIQKATAKNPHDRYDDPLVFADDFHHVVGLSQTATTVIELLTQREQEVLGAILDGLSNKEIAQSLTVTLSTVKWYVNQIYGKLGVRSRVQAMVRARELNLLEKPQESKLLQPVSARTTPVENPYKGLRAFHSADYLDFFGRENVTAKLVKRLAEQQAYSRFLAVVGPSGSGKSSLIEAGLIPALWRGDLPGSEKWYVLEMIPGSRPLDELEIALTRVAATRASHLYEHLRRDDHGLLRAAHLILPDDGSDLVLIIDQFEEVFTLVEDENVRAHVLNLLYCAVTDPHSRVRVIITLRADFYDRPLHYPEFGELIQNRLETLLPLSAADLERAIAKPVERMEMVFEEGLVSSIVADVNAQPGALPLLQYALTELFNGRQGHILTREAYQAIGGAVGALAKRADDVYMGMSDAGRETIRQMFLRLVTLGEGVEDTRRRVLRSELLAAAADVDLMDEVVDLYASYRLLSLDTDPATRSPTVELAHEAILRQWSRLSLWMSHYRDDIRWQRQLAATAAEWLDARQESSFLLRGTRLDQFDQWARETTTALTQQERQFLDASRAEREAQRIQEQARLAHEALLERRSVQRLRLLVVVFAVAAVVAVILSIIALNTEGQVRADFVNAERARLASQAQVALDQGEDVRVPALLAIRSLQLGYSLEADAALLTALSRSYSRQTYRGHTDALSSAVFSPDGHFVLTAATDATARLWDTMTGKQLLAFVGHSGLVNRAIFSPDGAYVLTAGTDGTVRQWDAKTGREMRRLVDQGSPVHALAISPDGRLFVTSDDSGAAQLRSFATGAVIEQLVGHTDAVNDAAFSADGQFVATGSFDQTARLWETATGNEVTRFEGHEGCVCSVALSSDGKLLATGSYDGTARTWDIQTGDEVQRFTGHTGQVLSVAISPDSQFIATAAADLSVRVWDVASGQELRKLLGHTANPNDVAFSPDGQFVLSASTDNTARLWAIQIQNEPRRFVNPIGVLHSNSVIMVALSNDDRQVITVNGAGVVQFWSVDTQQVVHQISTDNGQYISNAALSPDQRFVVTPGGDGIARLWNVATGDLVRQYDVHSGPITTVAFSPDGESILIGTENGATALLDRNSSAVRQHFVGHDATINSVAFSPDGRLVATASDDGTARTWDVQSGSELRRFAGQQGEVLSVAFSPDGKLLLTGGEDKVARLWIVETGEELRQFVGHNLPVRMATFSADGRQVITASSDQTARIWDTDTGQVLRQFVGHVSIVRVVMMSTDNQLLLSGDIDGAYLWRVNLQQVIQIACSRISEDFTADEHLRYAIRDDQRICGT